MKYLLFLLLLLPLSGLQAQHVPMIKKPVKPKAEVQPPPATKVKTKTVVVNRNEDRDNDGIVDDKDDCPDEYGPIKNGGCPEVARPEPVKPKNDLLPYEPAMVFVQGGSFEMGSNSGESDEKPVHRVTLDDYYIGKYEVTQAQWEAVMGENPSKFKGCANCPVENVSWEDVQIYLRKLKKLTGKVYRLPTEAEWEYAARGGRDSDGYVYAGSTIAESAGWINSNSGSKTHEVGGKKANELGIYDMTGNVWEWCNDWAGAYSSSASSNPLGPSSGAYRVLRGGSWFNIARFCRVAFRYGNTPENRNGINGFRVALVP